MNVEIKESEVKRIKNIQSLCKQKYDEYQIIKLGIILLESEYVNKWLNKHIHQ